MMDVGPVKDVQYTVLNIRSIDIQIFIGIIPDIFTNTAENQRERRYFQKKKKEAIDFLLNDFAGGLYKDVWFVT
jgi:hypothetical protein